MEKESSQTKKNYSIQLNANQNTLLRLITSTQPFTPFACICHDMYAILQSSYTPHLTPISTYEYLQSRKTYTIQHKHQDMTI